MDWQCIHKAGVFIERAGEFIEHFLDGDISAAFRSLISLLGIEYPPISIVLARNGAPDLLDQLNNGLKFKKTNAIEHIGNMLSDMGLDHLTAAFKKAVEEDMICRRCGKKIDYIDKLCYCPDSGEKCHHGTNCCDNRKIKCLTSGSR